MVLGWDGIYWEVCEIATFDHPRDDVSEVFIECIFDLEDSLIDNGDIECICDYYGKHPRETAIITQRLLHRSYTNHCPQLNIGLLFTLWDEMDDDEFDYKIRPLFRDMPRLPGDIISIISVDSISDYVKHLASQDGKEHRTAATRIIEALLYFLDVGDLDEQTDEYWYIRDISSHKVNKRPIFNCGQWFV